MKDNRRRSSSANNNYAKIDIFVNGTYAATTTRVRYPRDAVSRYRRLHPNLITSKVSAHRQHSLG